MGVYDERLWQILEQKAGVEDAGLRSERQSRHDYLAGVRAVCEFGVKRATRTAESFPLFTLHDEVHICNVLRLMAELLGDKVEQLSRDEAAMLILAACCHDLGMSYSKAEMAELLADHDRLNRYLDRHHDDFVKVYQKGMDKPELPDDVRRKYLRSIHHERAAELLNRFDWPKALNGKVRRDDLIRVCHSHGESYDSLRGMDARPRIDLRLCAVLLRLADLLDFDTSRAPKAVYDYYGFDKLTDPESTRSRASWQKHMESHGFDFDGVEDRSYPYELPYAATCTSMQREQAINSYLDWVDAELLACGKLVHTFTEKWRTLVLPGEVSRRIKARGYVSGQYRLSLDQDKTLELLVGEELYSDPGVFVRELIQNAIDAVRTREKLDQNLPAGWKGQIRIRTWMDDEGYHWFRIEDNGLGMTREIIENHLLKIGSSYYTSPAFEQEKLRRGVTDYTPISRFGIGLLSCFMGDRAHNRVEISTRHYGGGSALRLSMEGMSGYYFLTDSGQGHRGKPMPGVTEAEKKPYRNEGGTAVAVRTNLYQSGNCRGFREIVDKYVCCPPVPIRYEEGAGLHDYITEQDFMDAVHSVHPSADRAEDGLLEFPFPEEPKQELTEAFPWLEGKALPKVRLKCAALDRYTQSPDLKGAVLLVKLSQAFPGKLSLGGRDFPIEWDVGFSVDGDRKTLQMGLKAEIRSNDRNDFYKLRDSWRSAIQALPFSPAERAIADALLRGELHGEHRKRAILRDYELSPADWESAVSAVLDRCAEAVGVSPSAICSAFVFHPIALVSFPILDLSRYAWYCRCFQPLSVLPEYHKSHVSLTAHNGIACGDAAFFLDAGRCFLDVGLLLKDAYRPGLSLARDAVRGLPPALAWELETVRRSLCEEGYSAYSTDSLTVGLAPLSTQACGELLEQRPDLAAQFSVSTDKGRFRIDGLPAALREHGILTIEAVGTLEARTGSGGVYNAILLVALQRRYTLQIHIEKDSSYILLSDRRGAADDARLLLFPPGFFLPPDGTSGAVLATRNSNSRLACNAEHPLSRFLLENGAVLAERTPGLFREFLRTLTEDDRDKLIPTVNGLLERLRALPGGLISVPADLKLTEADFKS